MRGASMGYEIEFKLIDIKDINKISYAVYILELSEQVVKQTNQNIFDLMLSGLIKINEGYDPLIIMNIIIFAIYL